MFRVTRAEEQAVRLMMRMAILARQVTLGELALGENLPEPTVAKLLGMLRRRDVVRAVRGRHGGYVLAADPGDISVAQVIHAVSKATTFEYPCRSTNEPPDCPRTNNCGLRPVWQYLDDRVSTVLQQTSIADLLRRETTVEQGMQRLWPL